MSTAPDDVGPGTAAGRCLDAVWATTTAAVVETGTVAGHCLDAVEATLTVVGGDIVHNHLVLRLLGVGRSRTGSIRRRELEEEDQTRTPAQTSVAGGLVAPLQNPEWWGVLEKGSVGDQNLDGEAVARGSQEELNEMAETQEESREEEPCLV